MGEGPTLRGSLSLLPYLIAQMMFMSRTVTVP